MKALTVRQPWASLIAVGAKSIETRGWSTTYRGPLVIHAGLQVQLGRIGTEGEGWDVVRREDGAVEMFPEFYAGRSAGRLYLKHHPVPLGAVVASCQLVDVAPINTSGAAMNRTPWLDLSAVIQQDRL